MDESKLMKLRNLYSILSNVKRLKIIMLCNKKELSITQLSKELNLNYNVTSEYVSALEKAGLVKRKRNSDRTVTVRSVVKINDKGEIKKE